MKISVRIRVPNIVKLYCMLKIVHKRKMVPFFCFTVYYQSAYRRYHSIEIAVVIVYNDIVRSIDRREVTGSQLSLRYCWPWLPDVHPKGPLLCCWRCVGLIPVVSMIGRRLLSLETIAAAILQFVALYGRARYLVRSSSSLTLKMLWNFSIGTVFSPMIRNCTPVFFQTSFIAVVIVFHPASMTLSLIHIWRCRRIERCRSRWSPYH